jgi:hypothetical protein
MSRAQRKLEAISCHLLLLIVPSLLCRCTGAKYERAPRLRKDAMLDNSEVLDAFREWLEKDLQQVEGIDGTLESWLDAVRHFAQFIEPISLFESNYSEIGQFERELGRWHSGLRRFAEFRREVLRPKKQW